MIEVRHGGHGGTQRSLRKKRHGRRAEEDELLQNKAESRIRPRCSYPKRLVKKVIDGVTYE